MNISTKKNILIIKNMESDVGRFKVTAAPAEERVVGRFRLIQVIF